MVTVLVLIVTLITGSRGAWLGMGLGIVAVLAAALVLQPEAREAVRRLARTRLALSVVAVGVPIVVLGVAYAALSGRLTLDDSGYRAGFTRASIAMFESSPLTGVGPAIWATLRAANSLPTDPDLYIPHAHSIYFQTLAEYGLAGIVAGAGLVVDAWRAHRPVHPLW